jgi:ABC-type hemin transport system ATPase subunit
VVAAEDEARGRVEEASKAILEKVSDEVLRLVRLLGMTAADKVVIDRGAHARVLKGGTSSNFSNVTGGEQLRIRIATLLALMRTAKEYNRGRHPGFLIIDSPGNSEMKGENVEEVVRQRHSLVQDIDEVQIFVGLRNVQVASSLLPLEQYRAAAEGVPLW